MYVTGYCAGIQTPNVMLLTTVQHLYPLRSRIVLYFSFKCDKIRVQKPGPDMPFKNNENSFLTEPSSC